MYVIDHLPNIFLSRVYHDQNMLGRTFGHIINSWKHYQWLLIINVVVFSVNFVLHETTSVRSDIIGSVSWPVYTR